MPATVDLGVSLIHFVSGEDIIARVEYDVGGRVYCLYRPTTPMMKPKMDGLGNQVGVGMTLVPYRMFLDAEEPLQVCDSNVLFIGKLQDGLAKHYLEVTSSVVVADVAIVGVS